MNRYRETAALAPARAIKIEVLVPEIEEGWGQPSDSAPLAWRRRATAVSEPRQLCRRLLGVGLGVSLDRIADQLINRIGDLAPWKLRPDAA